MNVADQVVVFNKIVRATLEISRSHWLQHGKPIEPQDAILVAVDVAKVVGASVFARPAMTLEEARRIAHGSDLHQAVKLEKGAADASLLGLFTADQLEASATLMRAGEL